jgi:hypothetical protein
MKSLLLIFLIAGIQVAHADEDAFAGIRSDLGSGRIVAVELRFIPYEISTIVAITPEMLTAMTHPIKLDGKVLDLEGLTRAIGKSKSKKTQTLPDLRTGIIFLSRENAPLHTVYLDGRYLTGTGRNGIIDGQAVRLNGSIQSWVEPFKKKFGTQLGK